jgi:integrase
MTVITADNGPVACNRARSTLSKLYAWAIGEGLCDANPVVGTNKRDENGPRERSLSNAEVAQVWLAAPDDDYGRILKLLLLTGCRRAEIGDLKWSEIDLEARTITLPGERTKNGQQHVVPLADSAIAILTGIERRADREHVFGHTRAGGFCAWSGSKREFDAVLKMKEPWTVHDLRRTVRTGLGELGVQPHIAEAVINHVPPKLVRTYDRNTYAAEKRDALDKWASHLKVTGQCNGLPQRWLGVQQEALIFAPKRYSPSTRRRCSSRISSAMLVRESCTSSANGAFGLHERQDSAGMRPVTAASG